MSPAPTFPPVALLTKTRRADFDAFEMQLQSLDRSGSTMRHLVLVDDLDLAEARVRFAGLGTELLAATEVLPNSYVRCEQITQVIRSARSSSGVRRVPARAASRLARLAIGDLSGWWGQQVAKFAACVENPSMNFVSVDSDVIFLKRPEPNWFLTDTGRPKLFVNPSHSLKELEWKLRAHAFLGIDRFGDEPSTYVTFPQVLSAPLVVELVELLERSGPGPWWATMLRRKLTEYELYGSFAQFVSTSPTGVELERGTWSHEVSGWRTEASISELAARLADTATMPRVVCVQSNLDHESKTLAWSLLDRLVGLG